MINVEVCIDNIESLFSAQNAGAGRIELCSALALGGLTPSSGLIQQVVKHATIPVYSMIRPRDGDFLYSSHEIEMMLNEIHSARTLGVQGVVLGVLNAQSEVDVDSLKALMREAKDIGVTFHRAIDCCADETQALEEVIGAGCERVLTSGLATSASKGVDAIKKMVKQSNNKISIMAGAGINANNVADIVKATGINEVHLSGKKARASHMKQVVNCGHLAEFLTINVSNESNIEQVKQALQHF